ncbi:MAG: anthranilate synthase component I [Lentisphaeria bacterium]|nr:anthranilate synthase component I [Lentisphaeria bacterium]
MDLATFKKLAGHYNVIPFVREYVADFDTPIRLIDRLRGHGPSYLLESVEGGEQWGRYSIVGFCINKTFSIVDGQAQLKIGSKVSDLAGNPVDALQNYLKQFCCYEQDGLPRFYGGAAGYFSFESVRFFERCGEVKENDGRFPDASFFISDHLAIFDNLLKKIQLVHCVHIPESADLDKCYEDGLSELERMYEILNQNSAPNAPSGKGQEVQMTTNMEHTDFLKMVEKAKEYIYAGDIIQVVLAQHFSAEIDAHPLDVYRALRHINPSPYMYYMDFGDGRAIAGSSPEVMVRQINRKAELRPIAGTLPRGKTKEEDQHNAETLLADPKERAEHVMLVDLARNDLGRVCEIGSVNVEDYMVIERYSHVMHIVSQVAGTVREDMDALDVFKASFPAGTLSGAPKVRAMEIINELEPAPRGPYGGALGYISYGCENMDMAITIRTVVMDGKKATITAGAGVVFDSLPENEYQETRHKSRGMRRALQLAENALELEA